MSEWISVNDRLPNNGEIVIGYGIILGDIGGETYDKYVQLGEWDNGIIKISDDHYSVVLIQITHWQPAPLPPNPA